MISTLFVNLLEKVFGSPPIPKVSYYLDRIKRCPCKKDITIERSSHIGSGTYGSIKGKAYHSVYCSADGPNGDGSYHHGYIGFWQDFSSFEEANAFACTLYNKVIELTGYTPHIYASHKDKNAHAAWCLGKRKNRPRGIDPNALPNTFKEYR